MPVVIGSQTDVPSAGDPIVSPWYQDTARKIVHVFPTVTALKAWASPPNGAAAYVSQDHSRSICWYSSSAGGWLCDRVFGGSATTDASGKVSVPVTAAAFTQIIHYDVLVPCQFPGGGVFAGLFGTRITGGNFEIWFRDLPAGTAAPAGRAVTYTIRARGIL